MQEHRKAPQGNEAQQDSSGSESTPQKLIERARAGDPHAIRAVKRRMAARKHGQAQPAGVKSDVTFSDDEAAQDAAAPKQDALKQALSGGAGGVKAPALRDAYEGDGIAADGMGEAMEDITEHVKDGAAKTAGLAFAARAMLIPRIVSMVKEHKYKEALTVIKETIGPEEKVEFAKLLAEKLMGELSPKILSWFTRAALGAAVLSVLELGWEWFELGINSIHEAHERGDRNSANAIFAWAYADTLVNGSHSNPGAIDAEEIEARNKGIELAHVAREQCPELPFALKAEYGDGRNAMHAVQDGLLKKAGIAVRSHSGR
jgi:hypothetical protein